MPENKLICPGGISTQTGAAASRRCPSAEIVECKDIEIVKELIESKADPFCVPIWNSNVGEITKSLYVWDFIVEDKIKIHDLWAQEIEFWHVRKRIFPSFGKLIVILGTTISICIINSCCLTHGVTLKFRRNKSYLAE